MQDLKQRAKIKWSIDGDENTTFFHGVINSHASHNRINGLYHQGEWLSESGKLKDVVFESVQEKFKEPIKHRPSFRSAQFKKLSPEMASELIREFSLEEVKEAVWSCGGEKSPCPDGFTFQFIKRFWDILKGDFLRVARYFHEEEKINRGCNCAFIVLIPKNNDPQSIGDFRPISLVGCINKVISKILALRLTLVMDSIISPCQTAFIAGRHILDGPLIMNESISWLKRSKKKAVILKVDFNKAYDSLNWNFLDSVMDQMEFPAKWRRWIRECLSTARSSILINGSPTKEFVHERGVRQGDSLSPFLFISALEALHVMMIKAKEEGLIKVLKLPNGEVTLSNLFYTDDVLFINEWAEEDLENLRRMLICFDLVSGLATNFHKSSCIGVNLGEKEATVMEKCVGFRQQNMPITYLGLPIGWNMNRKIAWASVIQKVEARLSGWKAKTLSFGGKITLIKSVLSSIPLYFFSLFKAPKTVIDKLESIRSKFLWGGNSECNKIRWVAWDRITSPVDSGGLGVNKLEDMNKALLGKWWWRFKNEPNSLCVKTVSAIHHRRSSRSFIPCNPYYWGVWKEIVRIESHFQKNSINNNRLMRAKVGNGLGVFFWQDCWAHSCLLKVLFPDVYRAETNKWCSVFDKTELKKNSSWTTQRTWAEVLINQNRPVGDGLGEQLDRLKELLGNIPLSENNDTWLWNEAEGARFRTTFLRNKICEARDVWFEGLHDWNKRIPLKVNFFTWRAKINRLPTKDQLIRRGITLQDDKCSICGFQSKDVNHILFKCEFANFIWTLVQRWCKIPLSLTTLKHWDDVGNIVQQSKEGKKKRGNTSNSLHYIVVHMESKEREDLQQ